MHSGGLQHVEFWSGSGNRSTNGHTLNGLLAFSSSLKGLFFFCFLCSLDYVPEFCSMFWRREERWPVPKGGGG